MTRSIVFGSARRMQRSKDQVAGGGGSKGEFYRFEVAHFADQNDVRILTQCSS